MIAFRAFRAACLVGVLATAAPAVAVPITYAITGVGTGTVGPTAFTDKAYLICIATDTAQVASEGGTNLVTTTTTNITITDLGSTLVTEAVGFVVAQPSGQAAFLRVAGLADLLTMTDPAFQAYGATSAFGPIANLVPTNLGQFTNLQTSLGAMALTSSGNVTFQATLGPCPPLVAPPAATSVPVPATSGVTLGALAGLLALAAAWVRRRRAAPARVR